MLKCYLFSKQTTSRLPLKPTGALTEGVLLKLCSQNMFKQKHLLQ